MSTCINPLRTSRRQSFSPANRWKQKEPLAERSLFRAISATQHHRRIKE